jgi:hypothetical protein
MKIKLIGTLVALNLILGGGFSLAMGGGGGGISGHSDMMGSTVTAMSPGSRAHDTGSVGGSQVGMGQQGMPQDSVSPSGQSQGVSRDAQGVSNTDGTTGKSQSHQAPGGPPSCH